MKYLSLMSFLGGFGIAILTPILSIQAVPVSEAYINFAGAGGDFLSRTANFRVPETKTTTVVKDGLRLYDLHLARMLEVSVNYCQDRESSYLFYWNYEADHGKIFMGQFSWSCQFARNVLKEFGTSGPKEITIHHVDNPQVTEIRVLDLTPENARSFMKLVQSIKPKCLEMTPKICPGDHLN